MTKSLPTKHQPAVCQPPLDDSPLSTRPLWRSWNASVRPGFSDGNARFCTQSPPSIRLPLRECKRPPAIFTAIFARDFACLPPRVTVACHARGVWQVYPRQSPSAAAIAQRFRDIYAAPPARFAQTSRDPARCDAWSDCAGPAAQRTTAARLTMRGLVIDSGQPQRAPQSL